MKLLPVKALWGMDGDLEEQFRRIAEAGYAGIEAKLPEPHEEAEFLALLAEYRLAYIPILSTRADHVASLAAQVAYVEKFQPLLITAHAGRDFESLDEQLRFFEGALRLEEASGIPIAHETHRRRPMFTPWHTARFLQEFPNLHIAADFSHWCCVTESLLEDHQASLELAMAHSIHIHGRVGNTQSPQVPDPRDPAYAAEVATHERWWVEICKQAHVRGAEFLPFTPEYGPPPYQDIDPKTHDPLANHWEVCNWALEHFRSRPDTAWLNAE